MPVGQMVNIYPRHPMYAIYAYIGVVSGVNVCKYGSPMECLGMIYRYIFIPSHGCQAGDGCGGNEQHLAHPTHTLGENMCCMKIFKSFAC